MTIRLQHIALAVAALAACADLTPSSDPDGSDAQNAHRDARPDPADATEDLDLAPPDTGSDDYIPCSEPNPTRFGDSGSYCVPHLNGNCLDTYFSHECIEGYWRCPQPDMILVRECTSFGYPLPDSGMPEVGSSDIGRDDGG